MGLEGEDPENIIASQIAPRVEKIYQKQYFSFLGEKKIPFVEKEHMLYLNKRKPFHSNSLVFSAYDNEKKLLEKTYYSIGGGFVIEDTQLDEKGHLKVQKKRVPYYFLTAEKLLSYCKENSCSIAEITLKNEQVFRNNSEIDKGLKKIWKTNARIYSSWMQY